MKKVGIVSCYFQENYGSGTCRKTSKAVSKIESAEWFHQNSTAAPKAMRSQTQDAEQSLLSELNEWQKRK